MAFIISRLIYISKNQNIHIFHPRNSKFLSWITAQHVSSVWATHIHLFLFFIAFVWPETGSNAKLIKRTKRYKWKIDEKFILRISLILHVWRGGGRPVFRSHCCEPKTPFCLLAAAAQLTPGRGKTQYNFLSTEQSTLATLSLQPNNGLINQAGNTRLQYQKFNISFQPCCLSVIDATGHCNWEWVENKTL